MSRPYRILVLCTGNSARSIIAEFLLRAKGRGRFEVYSAGARPTGRVNPLAMRVLREKFNLDASSARSKSWEEFRDVPLDLVITVCDHARESCPHWPGAKLLAHWESPDPASVEGTEADRLNAFVRVAEQIERRVDRFCALTDSELLQAGTVRAIGEIP